MKELTIELSSTHYSSMLGILIQLERYSFRKDFIDVFDLPSR
jgi:hypothetical protein